MMNVLWLMRRMKKNLISLACNQSCCCCCCCCVAIAANLHPHSRVKGEKEKNNLRNQWEFVIFETGSDVNYKYFPLHSSQSSFWSLNLGCFCCCCCCSSSKISSGVGVVVSSSSSCCCESSSEFECDFRLQSSSELNVILDCRVWQLGWAWVFVFSE